MRKLYEILNRAEPLKGDYGIEIEAEGQGMLAVNNKWWSTHDDGSLRGVFPESRAEYVLNSPIQKRFVRTVLRNLSGELKDAQFSFSFRTSVHVHMNAQDLTYDQILNVIYTYLLLEEPFLTYCGRERKGNRFCLRLQDAEGLLDAISKLINHGEDGISVINVEAVRYAAINLGALVKYGSIEFRAMRGNMDVETIAVWVDALHNLKEFAKSVADPVEIFELFRNIGMEGFFNKVLGNVAENFKYQRVFNDMARSYSISIDLPYAYKEAKELQEKNKEMLANLNAAPPIDIAAVPLPRGNQAFIKQIRVEVRDMFMAGRDVSAAYLKWMDNNDPKFLEKMVYPRMARRIDRLIAEGIIEHIRPAQQNRNPAAFADAVFEQFNAEADDV